MGRKSTVQEIEVFRAVGTALTRHGHVSIADIRESTGLSTGSLYHRFGSREGLMAEAWLHGVSAFQRRFVAALAEPSIEAAEQAALATPRFCREEPETAMVLVCCRPSEFLTPETPASIHDRVRGANDAASRRLGEFARAIGRPLLTCRLALVAYPVGAVRLFLPSQPVPEALDDELRKMVRAVLGVGG